MIVLQDYGNPSKSEGNHESGSVAGFASPAVITAGSMFLVMTSGKAGGLKM